ncbi:hypothetical protein [Gryllotalpicola ginsengisoli]|uniref:hypothetical protein n=1 Tax=Gryllotalpicola ginsengisoli TaxID=444608 RepID=UPI0003B36925|nr:hypothetical protein [Gryllotalpicola ginsengisoli]
MPDYQGDTPGQPLKGDPDVVAGGAKTYHDVAQMIKRAHATLSNIRDGNSDMVGEVFDAIKSVAGDVADDVYRAYQRYHDTATALHDYSVALRKAQDHMNNVVLPSITSKYQAATDAYTDYAKGTDDKSPGDDDLWDDYRSASKAYDDALGENGEWAEGWSWKGTPADHSADKIEDLVEHNNQGLKDPGWFSKAVDSVKSFARSALHVLKKIGDFITPVLIVMAFIPGLGEFAMAALAVISIIDGLSDIMDGHWVKGLLSIGLAFGAGKLAEVGLKGLKGAMSSRVLEGLEGASAKAFKSLKGPAKSAIRKVYNTTNAKAGIGDLNRLKNASKLGEFKSAADEAAQVLNKPRQLVKTLWREKNAWKGPKKFALDRLKKWTNTEVYFKTKDAVKNVKELRRLNQVAKELENDYPGISKGLTKYKVAMTVGSTLEVAKPAIETVEKGTDVAKDISNGDWSKARDDAMPSDVKKAVKSYG